MDIKEKIRQLFATFQNNEIVEIKAIPQSGSDRHYYRIISNQQTFIATYSLNIKENKAFIDFTNHFKKINAPVPEIFAISDDYVLYIQEDFGPESLLNMLESKGHTDEIYALFADSLSALANVQINGNQNFDYGKCLVSQSFGSSAILADLLYFKYYFADTLQIPYDKELLMKEFEKLSVHLSSGQHHYFMYRDFQSRNIMVKAGKIHFIDYQGGMKGPLCYDVASLLWQAKAALPKTWKDTLLEHYIQETNRYLSTPLNPDSFKEQYHGFVLIRLLQVLGAYGFRGLFEKKEHFISSIPAGLTNLKSWMESHSIGDQYPELQKLMQAMVAEEVIRRFENIKATEQTPLKIKINSFSYLQNGYPKNETKNGGGFVFDCRGILNPGRKEEYKTQSGQDKAVIEFLEQQTRMPKFLQGIFDTIDITVEDYIQRGFENLEISFGCTGGQHRSVYAAEATEKHLRKKYGVKTELHHMNQKNWVVSIP